MIIVMLEYVRASEESLGFGGRVESLHYAFVGTDNLGNGKDERKKGGGLREGSSDRQVHSQNVQSTKTSQSTRKTPGEGVTVD
jgi:hypothetical protein